MDGRSWTAAVHEQVVVSRGVPRTGWGTGRNQPGRILERCFGDFDEADIPETGRRLRPMNFGQSAKLSATTVSRKKD